MQVSNSRWRDIKGNSKVTIAASSKNYYTSPNEGPKVQGRKERLSREGTDVSRCPRKCQDEEKGSHAEIKSGSYICIILMVESWKKGFRG